MSNDKQQPRKDEHVIICQNRRATHDFAIDDRYEAGLVLTGTEVKACRAGHAHLNDAYVHVNQGEATLLGAHIGEYSFGNRFNHEPARARRLLLHGHEIAKLYASLREKGYTGVALSLYFKNGRIKLAFGIGKGKTGVDRRQDIRARDDRREIERTFRKQSR